MTDYYYYYSEYYLGFLVMIERIYRLKQLSIDLCLSSSMIILEWRFFWFILYNVYKKHT